MKDLLAKVFTIVGDALAKIAAIIGDAIERWIRTIVPIAVTYFAAKFPFLADQFALSPEALTAFTLMGYYTLFAFLETKVHPYFGWFLGKPKTPVYEV